MQSYELLIRVSYRRGVCAVLSAARFLTCDFLRTAIALWAGHQKAPGRSDAEGYRRFYYSFDQMDVLTAMALNADESLKLANKINEAVLLTC